MRFLAAPLVALSLLGASAGAQGTPDQVQQTAAVTAPAPAQLTAADVNAWLDGIMPYALSNADIVGAVVTVVHNGEVIANRGYGYADLEHRTPVDANATLFRPGSISKLFTWTAVMQLVEREQIDLDADVNAYLDFQIPAYRGQPITMRQIMTHTSGFEEVVRDLILSNAPNARSLGDYLRENIPSRIYPPGTMPAYSNYATALAGYIVARVSGESFEDYVKRHIFDPLGMQHSTFVQPLPEGVGVLSGGYKNLRDGEPQAFEIIPASPAGALSSTGADMARFMNAHLNQGAGLMLPETARLMHDTIDRQFPGVNSMALGFYQDNANGQRIIGHGGDTQWFHSNLSLMQDQNVGVYISLNSGGGPSLGGRLLRWELMSQFVDRYFPEPAGASDPEPLPTAREHGAAVAGDYESSRRAETNPLLAAYFVGQTSVQILPNGDLVGPGLPDVNGAPKHWREVEPWVWQAVGSHERMGARVDENGRVTAIAFEPLAFAIPSTRAPWWRSKSLLLPLFGAAMAIFALTFLSWPLRAILRRVHNKAFPYEGARAQAHRIAPAVSLLSIAYLGAWMGFLIWLMESLTTASSGMGAFFTTLYIAGIVPIVALAGAGYLNWSLWRAKSTWFAKIWGALLLLSAAIVLWFAVAMRFYSFDLSY
ncbi:MAG: serine hydrolase domain-containing protein [Vitreimonas sp.]